MEKSVAGSKPQSSDRSHAKYIAGAVAAVVALALALAVAFSGSNGDDAPAASEFGSPTISGTALPQVPAVNAGDASTDPAFGLPIPEVNGQNFAGMSVEIQRDGGPKALLFVSHGCPHCQDEIPEVQAWLDETGGVAGVDMVAISTSAREVAGNWPPSEWLKREGWSSPIVVDDKDLSVFYAYGGAAIPYWVFVDADGNVTRRFSGRLEIPLLELAMLEALTS